MAKVIYRIGEKRVNEISRRRGVGLNGRAASQVSN
jgi:hypothetical protein